MIRPRILLIDDDDALLYLFQRYAEQRGFALDKAPSVEAAHAMVGQLRPALIVLNRLLAATADPSALTALQINLAAHNIPIAGFAQAVVEAEAADLAIDYDLTLPLLYDDFCSALAALGVDRSSSVGDPTYL
jgi:ActR/RegA family two-component response regulator